MNDKKSSPGKSSQNIDCAAAEKCSLLAEAVLHSLDAIIVQDLTGRITAWNRGAEKLYGYSEAEALKMNFSALVPESAQQEFTELQGRILSGEKVSSIQTRRRTRNGQELDVWLTITRLHDKDGNTTGMAAIERDVTERSRLLEEIESSLSLAEEYSSNIERLVAERTASLIALNIADRIVNPSVVISMVCKHLLAEGQLQDSQKEKLSTIFEESEKLQQIIHEFSELLKGKPSAFSSEDFNTVVTEAIALIRKSAERKGIILVTKLSGSPVIIKMDRHILRTALCYIYKNSLEATPRGGTITTVTAEDGDSLTCTISDTGCGIEDKNVSRIFDSFFTTKVDAAGMGLTFVQHIINEHFGTINIESCSGEGTKCTLRFPLRWLKISEGSLGWGKPMLPVTREKTEYPLQATHKGEKEN